MPVSGKPWQKVLAKPPEHAKEKDEAEKSSDNASGAEDTGGEGAEQTSTDTEATFNTGGGETVTNTAGGQVVTNTAEETDSDTQQATENTTGTQSAGSSTEGTTGEDQENSETGQSTTSNSDVYNDAGRAPIVN